MLSQGCFQMSIKHIGLPLWVSGQYFLSGNHRMRFGSLNVTRKNYDLWVLTDYFVDNIYFYSTILRKDTPHEQSSIEGCINLTSRMCGRSTEQNHPLAFSNINSAPHCLGFVVFKVWENVNTNLYHIACKIIYGQHIFALRLPKQVSDDIQNVAKLFYFHSWVFMHHRKLLVDVFWKIKCQNIT